MDVEQSLRDFAERSIAVLREARAREESLRSDLSEALRWKQKYEEAAAVKQRLEHELQAAEQQATALRQLAATNNSRRLSSNLRTARTEVSHVRMRMRKLDSDGGRLEGQMSARGGLLPLPMSRTASMSKLQSLRERASGTCTSDAEPSQSCTDSRNASPQPPQHSRSSSSGEGNGWPVHVNRSPTMDISGLMSMFVTANLLQQDAYANAAVAASKQRQHQTPTVTVPDVLLDTPTGDGLSGPAPSPFRQAPASGVTLGPGGVPRPPPQPSPSATGQTTGQTINPTISAPQPLSGTQQTYTSAGQGQQQASPHGSDVTGKFQSYSGTGPLVEPSGRSRASNAFGRHTVDGASGVLEGMTGPLEAQARLSMSSVSLVDDDGTSGVGLAAAAAVAAAAARAWAAAASQQRQQTQQHRNTSAANGTYAPRSVSGSDASAQDLAVAATSGGGGSSQQGLAVGAAVSRKTGKVGYKLVASVYREPPPTTSKVPTLLMPPKHAASTANITSLASASPPPMHHAHTHSEFMGHAASSTSLQSLNLDQRGSGTPTLDSLGNRLSLHAESGGEHFQGAIALESASSLTSAGDLAQRAALAVEAVQQAVALSRGSTLTDGVPGGSFGADASSTGAEAGSSGVAELPGSSYTGSPVSVSHGALLHATRGLSPVQQPGPALSGVVREPSGTLRNVSERRGGWYGCGGVDSSGDLSELEEHRQASLSGSPTLSAATAAGAQGPSPLGAPAAPAAGSGTTAATGASYEDGIRSTPAKRSTRHLSAVGSSSNSSGAIQMTAEVTRTAGNEDGTDLPPVKALVVVGSSAAALATAQQVVLPLLLPPTAEQAGQLQGSFTLLQPTTCPGGHIASNTAVQAAVGHAVPVMVAGLAAGRTGHSVSVLKRESMEAADARRSQSAEGDAAGSSAMQQPARARASSEFTHQPDAQPAAQQLPEQRQNGTASGHGPGSPLMLTDISPAAEHQAHQPHPATDQLQPAMQLHGEQQSQGQLHIQSKAGLQSTSTPAAEPSGPASAAALPCGSEPDSAHGPPVPPATPSLPAPTPPAAPSPATQSSLPTHMPDLSVGALPPSLPHGSDSQQDLPACMTCDKDMTKSTALTLHWLSPPRTALVVCKLSTAVYPLLNTVLRWLRTRSLSVYVEPETYQHVDPQIMELSGSPAGSGSLQDSSCGAGVLTWPAGRCPSHSIPDEVAQDLDFVIVLGGDGTLLWTCHVFGNRAVPPLVPFNMGSLGFLTPFPPSQLDDMLGLVLAGGFPMILRHRLHATIVRVPRDGQPAVGDVYWADGHCATEKVVLNEVVVDRGISPFLTNLECYCDGNFVTHVQGDGLIISTPTGSTAYSLAAGGSMVHPQVPGILFTPVCPHSLSFRPLVFPDHVQLCIQVPHGARSQMYCSFDGKDRQELNAGDAIIIRMSQWPIPTVCSRDPSRDWFTGIREGLHWNERRVQGAANG